LGILREKGFTYEGTTTLNDIKDFVNNGKGFVVALVDISLIPTPRPRTDQYQGHYLIVYSVNSDNDTVKVLDPCAEPGKELTYKVSDFEKGRLALYVDQSCIFIDYNYTCGCKV
jgi:hypothetical protein